LGYQSTDNELVVKYIPLVKRIVARIESVESDMDKDDLFSIGVIGLIDAIKKYDGTKSVPFEAYATLRIKGTIIDEMRKSGRVSRDRINKLNRYYSAKEKLEQSLMRNPDEHEICRELGIGEKELYKLHETVHYLSSVSFESTLFSSEGGDMQFMDLIKDETAINPEEDYVRSERRVFLIKAIESLSERERAILNLYYVEELTLKEIAYAMEISIPRVSQIHGKIILKLRQELENYAYDGKG